MLSSGARSETLQLPWQKSSTMAATVKPSWLRSPPWRPNGIRSSRLQGPLLPNSRAKKNSGELSEVPLDCSAEAEGPPARSEESQGEPEDLDEVLEDQEEDLLGEAEDQPEDLEGQREDLEDQPEDLTEETTEVETTGETTVGETTAEDKVVRSG